MDANDRINLIEEFSKIKNSHVIVLTTFNFDPFFFDGFVLPILEKHNRSAQIIVLVDEGQYSLAYPRFTNRTGIDYHLIPIRLNQGVFHPKFFLFTSKDKITTFVGSSNLSLQGFTNNAELVIKTQTKLDDGISTETKAIIDVLNGLVSKKLIHDNHVLELFSRISDTLASKLVISSDDFQILHNLDIPIMPQMLSQIPEKTFEKLFVLAPFFSSDAKPLSEILSELKIKDIEFGLQKQNHNLKNIENVRKITTSKNANFSISSAQFLDTRVSEKEIDVPRRFHSKIIKLENSNKYLLAGSPNFTTEALLKTIDNGNFEFGLFFKNPNFDIMKQIKLDSSQENDILNTVRDTIFKFSNFDVSITSVFFDLVKRTLHISCTPTSKILEIKIKTKEPQNTISEKIDFSKQLISLPIDEGIPIEIEIIGESSSFKRRIFDDTDPVKRLFRTEFSIRTLTENTNELLKIDKFALLDIVRQISDSSVDSTSSSSHSVSTSESPHNHKYFPSLQSAPKNFGSTLSSFSKLLDSVEIQKEKIAKEEDFASDEEMDEILITSPTIEVDEESKNFKLLNKVLQKLFLILASYKKKNQDEDLIGIIVLYMKFFIDFSVQIFSVTSYSDIQTLSGKDSFRVIVGNFYENLEQFFENASKEDLTNSNSLNLLVVTLSMSLLSSQIIKNDKFLMGLHKIDFLDKKDYYQIRSYVQNVFEKFNVKITKKVFDGEYSEYSYKLYQTQPSKNIKSLIQTIVTEEDDSFLECLLIQLSKIHKQFSNELFKDLDYDKTTKGGKAAYSILGDYEDKHAWMTPW